MSPAKSNQSFFVIDLITTDEDKKYAPAGHIASAIISITQETGDCSTQDLIVMGFAPDEVTAHWHLAHSLAAVELKLFAMTKS